MLDVLELWESKQAKQLNIGFFHNADDLTQAFKVNVSIVCIRVVSVSLLLGIQDRSYFRRAANALDQVNEFVDDQVRLDLRYRNRLIDLLVS